MTIGRHTLMAYIRAHGLSYAFWCLNPNSGDTGGLLADNWTTVNAAKMALLRTDQAPLIGTPLRRPSSYATDPAQVAPRRVAPLARNSSARRSAYAWPHRPGSGLCRWPKAPIFSCTTPAGTRRLPRRRDRSRWARLWRMLRG